MAAHIIKLGRQQFHALDVLRLRSEIAAGARRQLALQRGNFPVELLAAFEQLLDLGVNLVGAAANQIADFLQLAFGRAQICKRVLAGDRLDAAPWADRRPARRSPRARSGGRSEEHTTELQSLM